MYYLFQNAFITQLQNFQIYWAISSFHLFSLRVGPLIFLACFVLLSTVVHCLLQGSVGSWHQLGIFVGTLLLVVYGYVALLPLLVWFWYRVVLKKRQLFAFRDGIVLSCCLGYSLIFTCVLSILLYLFNEMRMLIFTFITYQSGTFLCKSAGRLWFSGIVLSDEAGKNVMLCLPVLLACASFHGFLCFTV